MDITHNKESISAEEDSNEVDEDVDPDSTISAEAEPDWNESRIITGNLDQTLLFSSVVEEL